MVHKNCSVMKQTRLCHFQPLSPSLLSNHIFDLRMNTSQRKKGELLRWITWSLMHTRVLHLLELYIEMNRNIIGIILGILFLKLAVLYRTSSCLILCVDTARLFHVHNIPPLHTQYFSQEGICKVYAKGLRIVQ